MSKLAKLDQRQLEELKKLENRWNVLLLAYEKPGQYAELSPEEMKKIRSLEKKLDVILVAYRRPLTSGGGSHR
jgi:division protein CdvB (Snf7/Vps24/ESCRT-III family)